jgi:hypothetical protein
VVKGKRSLKNFFLRKGFRTQMSQGITIPDAAFQIKHNDISETISPLWLISTKYG